MLKAVENPLKSLKSLFITSGVNETGRQLLLTAGHGIVGTGTRIDSPPLSTADQDCVFIKLLLSKMGGKTS